MFFLRRATVSNEVPLFSTAEAFFSLLFLWFSFLESIRLAVFTLEGSIGLSIYGIWVSSLLFVSKSLILGTASLFLAFFSEVVV